MFRISMHSIFLQRLPPPFHSLNIPLCQKSRGHPFYYMSPKSCCNSNCREYLSPFMPPRSIQPRTESELWLILLLSRQRVPFINILQILEIIDTKKVWMSCFPIFFDLLVGSWETFLSQCSISFPSSSLPIASRCPFPLVWSRLSI